MLSFEMARGLTYHALKNFIELMWPKYVKKHTLKSPNITLTFMCENFTKKFTNEIVSYSSSINKGMMVKSSFQLETYHPKLTNSLSLVSL